MTRKCSKILNNGWLIIKYLASFSFVTAKYYLVKALTTRTCIYKLLLRRYTVCIDKIAIGSCVILKIRHKSGEDDYIELNLRLLLGVANLH